MRKRIKFKGIEVSYTDRGEGACIFLLHGYLETSEIWEEFVPLLTGRFRVITLDIPGHGRSGSWGKEHSMNDLAGTLKKVLDAEGIETIVLAGHSMGGYVALAFATLYPKMVAGYVLFHSTCFADTEEKRVNRDREISLVLCGRKRQIINVNIPKAFADCNVEKLHREIIGTQEIAYQNEDPGIVALLNGMKNREDLSDTLSDPAIPLLLIVGMKDNYIPVEVFEKLISMAPHASVLKLAESGHMGFIEEAGRSAEALLEFADKVSRPVPE
ncbi:MAG: alpha/beta hydrolase [Bacteroidetes bacterium]|nr:alpha/beta hydrolase [Bacteroidota bacterium]